MALTVTSTWSVAAGDFDAVCRLTALPRKADDDDDVLACVCVTCPESSGEVTPLCLLLDLPGAWSITAVLVRSEARVVEIFGDQQSPGVTCGAAESYITTGKGSLLEGDAGGDEGMDVFEVRVSRGASLCRCLCAG